MDTETSDTIRLVADSVYFLDNLLRLLVQDVDIDDVYILGDILDLNCKGVNKVILTWNSYWEKINNILVSRGGCGKIQIVKGDQDYCSNVKNGYNYVQDCMNKGYFTNPLMVSRILGKTPVTFYFNNYGSKVLADYSTNSIAIGLFHNKILTDNNIKTLTDDLFSDDLETETLTENIINSNIGVIDGYKLVNLIDAAIIGHTIEADIPYLFESKPFLHLGSITRSCPLKTSCRNYGYVAIISESSDEDSIYDNGFCVKNIKVDRYGIPLKPYDSVFLNDIKLELGVCTGVYQKIKETLTILDIK
jgi:hypothetical protein